MDTLKNNNRSFHRRIREGGSHYFDQSHFLGIDPFDKTKFHEKYEEKKVKPVLLPKPE